MKKLVSFLLLIPLVAFANEAAPKTSHATVGPEVLIVCDEATMQAFTSEPVSNDILKSKQSNQQVAHALTGLIPPVAELVAARNDHEKKQGILNLLGTIFTVAAQLIGASHRVYQSDNEEKLVIQTGASQGAIAITLQFFDILSLEKDPAGFISDNDILMRLFELNNQDEQITSIETIMADEKNAYTFWNSLSGSLEDYIQFYLGSTLDLFNQAIAYTYDIQDQSDCGAQDNFSDASDSEYFFNIENKNQMDS